MVVVVEVVVEVVLVLVVVATGDLDVDEVVSLSISFTTSAVQIKTLTCAAAVVAVHLPERIIFVSATRGCCLATYHMSFPLGLLVCQRPAVYVCLSLGLQASPHSPYVCLSRLVPLRVCPPSASRAA